MSTIKAFDPDAALKTDKVVVLELLQTTLMKQTPGVTEELISVVITVSDIMLHARAGTSHAIAVQDCDSEMKLVPDMVIRAPG